MEFVKRHQKKFKIVALVSATLFVGAKYFKSKCSQMLYKRDLESLQKQHLKQRFEQNVKDIYFTVNNLMASFCEQLYQELDVDTLLVQIRQQGLVESKKQKREKWNLLLIKGFSRTISAIFLLNCLVLLTTIQISLLGKRAYLDSVSADIMEYKQVKEGVSLQTERQYLTLSWYILNIGWLELVKKVTRACENVFKNIPIHQEIDHSRLISIIADIKSEINFNDLLIAILPPEGLEEKILLQGGASSELTSDFKNLMDETRDFSER
jgi:peroxin-3